MFFTSEYVLLLIAALTARNRPCDGYFVDVNILSLSKSPAFTRFWNTSRTWSGSTLNCRLRKSSHVASSIDFAKLSETRRDVPFFTSTNPAPVMRTETRRTGSRVAL